MNNPLPGQTKTKKEYFNLKVFQITWSITGCLLLVAFHL